MGTRDEGRGCSGEILAPSASAGAQNPTLALGARIGAPALALGARIGAPALALGARLAPPRWRLGLGVLQSRTRGKQKTRGEGFDSLAPRPSSLITSDAG